MATSIPYSVPSPQLSLANDMRVNAPVYHQRTIARLVTGLTIEYRADKQPYEPLPEMMVGEYSSPTPDVVLYDNATETTPVIIEVCQTRGLKADLDKVIRLIDGELYDIREGFIYDYKTQQWLRYQLGDGGIATASSFSTVLQLDLNQFL